MLTCLVIGILSAFQVYAGQLLWPASEPFPNQTTAFVFAAQRAWAPLFAIIGFTLVVANFGSGMGAQLGAARLLFGMGRSNAIPRLFAAIDPKRHVPRNSVIFVGVVSLISVFIMSYAVDPGRSYNFGAQMLNFGALLAFMGVNAAAFVRYFVRNPEKKLLHFFPPFLGFLICLVLWWNLSWPAKIAGVIWMAIGIAFGVWRTNWFRKPLSFDVPEE